MKKSFLAFLVASLLATTSFLNAQLSIDVTGSTLSGSFDQTVNIQPNGRAGWTNNGFTNQFAIYQITSTSLGSSGDDMLGGYIALWDNGGNLSVKYYSVGDPFSSSYSATGLAGTLASQTFTASAIAFSGSDLSILSSYLGYSATLDGKYPSNPDLSITVSAIPEPSTYAALLGGLALIGLGIRRKYGSKK